MAEIKIRLRPFTVPNYVIVEEGPRLRSEGIRESTKYALHELSDEAIKELLEEFENAIWAKVHRDRASANARLGQEGK